MVGVPCRRLTAGSFVHDTSFLKYAPPSYTRSGAGAAPRTQQNAGPKPRRMPASSCPPLLSARKVVFGFIDKPPGRARSSASFGPLTAWSLPDAPPHRQHAPAARPAYLCLPAGFLLLRLSPDDPRQAGPYVCAMFLSGWLIVAKTTNVQRAGVIGHLEFGPRFPESEMQKSEPLRSATRRERPTGCPGVHPRVNRGA